MMLSCDLKRKTPNTEDAERAKQRADRLQDLEVTLNPSQNASLSAVLKEYEKAYNDSLQEVSLGLTEVSNRITRSRLKEDAFKDYDDGLLRQLLMADDAMKHFDHSLKGLLNVGTMLSERRERVSELSSSDQTKALEILDDLALRFQNDEKTLYKAYFDTLGDLYPKPIPMSLWCKHEKELPSDYQATIVALKAVLNIPNQACRKIPFFLPNQKYALDLGSFNLKTILPLISLPEVKILNLAHSPDAPLYALFRNENLEHLDVSFNQSTPLPFFLRSLVNLKSLQADMFHSQGYWWTRILFMADFFNLKHLSLKKAGLESLFFLSVENSEEKSVFANLETLNVSQNPLSRFDLDHLKFLKKLKLIDLSQSKVNQFSDQNFPNLQILNVKQTPDLVGLTIRQTTLQTLNIIESSPGQMGRESVIDLRTNDSSYASNSLFPKLKVVGVSDKKFCPVSQKPRCSLTF
jgi:Leucine-rich repeat (LRR) protein